MLRKSTAAALIAAVTTLSAMPAAATDWSTVRAGAVSYVSSYSGLGMYFYARVGETLTFTNLSSLTTSMYCGLSAITSPSSIIKTSLLSSFDFIAPASTLYMLACVKWSGLSSDVMAGVFEQGFFTRSAEAEPEIDAATKEAFDEKLRANLSAMAGQ